MIDPQASFSLKEKKDTGWEPSQRGLGGKIVLNEGGEWKCKRGLGVGWEIRVSHKIWLQG
jgi:hypothetical protein